MNPLIYLATLWRNPHYNPILHMLKEAGCSVYDWRDPATAFNWLQVDPEYDGSAVSAERYLQLLTHERAKQGFLSDMSALEAAEAVVLLCPCGASAHLKAGWAKGAGKKLFVLIEREQRPELMYRMADLVTAVPQVLIDTAASVGSSQRR